MPTISLPPRTELTDLPSGVRTDRPSSSLTLRAHVAAHRRTLTRELSEGADPAWSPERTLRADQLTSERNRRALARSLRRAVHEARHPAPRRSSFALVRRGAVIGAANDIDILVKRLRSPEPIAPEGAALVERTLSDGVWSPLYSTAPGGALRRLVVLATAALEPAGIS
ncbi:MAG TPA: hypothetical protein VHW96_21155 [Solirubrobacteraceae bacterium]|nr:hypothetical protein [Solirubrobacteraceae bacterium]